MRFVQVLLLLAVVGCPSVFGYADDPAPAPTNGDPTATAAPADAPLIDEDAGRAIGGTLGGVIGGPAGAAAGALLGGLLVMMLKGKRKPGAPPPAA
jgi:hypothetical protein